MRLLFKSVYYWRGYGTYVALSSKWSSSVSLVMNKAFDFDKSLYQLFLEALQGVHAISSLKIENGNQIMGSERVFLKFCIEWTNTLTSCLCQKIKKRCTSKNGLSTKNLSNCKFRQRKRLHNMSSKNPWKEYT